MATQKEGLRVVEKEGVDAAGVAIANSEACNDI